MKAFLLAFITTLLATSAIAQLAPIPNPTTPLLFVWPQPTNFTFGSTPLLVNKGTFAFSSATTHYILKDALDRHQDYIFNYPALSKYIDIYESVPGASQGELEALNVNVANVNDTLHLGVDESYQLTIPMPSQGASTVAATLTANTLWGALRGLDTFSQLIDWNGTNWIIPQAPITISDKPRYPWRGFLLDTSRHYHPLWSIKHTIDAISFAKFNVLHWHLTDAESFPIQLKSRPEMSAKGAWDPSSVYSAQDVAEIIAYGQTRGVRVVPEIDTPGHTYSWGLSHPEVIVDCVNKIYNSFPYPQVNSVALDMTNPATYPIVKDVYQDVAAMFSDDYMHLGGDELAPSCLNEFPAIKQWMQQHNMSTTNYTDLVRYFRYNLTSYVTEAKKKMVVWQEAYEEMQNQVDNPLTKENTIVQVWKNDNHDGALTNIVNDGYHALMSAGWYLDQQIPSLDDTTHYLFQDTWMDFYAVEPTAGVNATEDQLNLILGGEVCQWGETANPYSIDGNVWARAAATAERLWSPKEVNDVKLAFVRLMRFQCWVLQHGVRTSPFRPNHCPSPLLDTMFAPSKPTNPVDAPQESLGTDFIQMPMWVVIVAAVIVGLCISMAVGLSIKMCLTSRKSNSVEFA